jgi:tetratricopeptide (TPR) repeat protein/cell division septation protein DedD
MLTWLFAPEHVVKRSLFYISKTARTMKTTFQLLFVLPCLLMASAAFSQSKNALVKQADRFYEIHAYNSAAETYEAALAKGAGNQAQVLARLASSYHFLNRLNEAAKHYQTLMSLQPVPPAAYLDYGHVLKSLERYDDAKKWYKEYARTDPSVGNHYAASCDYAISQLNTGPAYTLISEPINTSAAEFAPIFLQDLVVFASTRMDMQLNTRLEGSVANRLYASKVGGAGNLESPTPLRTSSRDKEFSPNNGPLAFSPDGKTVVYTVNNFVDGTRQVPGSGIDLNLFVAEINAAGEWINIKPFPYNQAGISNGYPAFSNDGNTLFFASNREGSIGGFDIWMTSRNGDSWSKPENLGKTVNSMGNEISPWYDGNSLYFSSDWHPGLGGFDVFRVDNVNSQWSAPFHLEKGVNSPADDYGFVFRNGNNMGYLVSNRIGGRGLEDIYRVSRVSEFITLRVINAADESPVSNVKIDFTRCGSQVFLTDSKGQYTFQMTPTMDCIVTVNKDGFQEFSFPIASIKIQASKEFTIRMVGSRNMFGGSITDLSGNKPLAGVSVQWTNLQTGNADEITSDASGFYTIPLSPNQSYSLRYSRAGYQDLSRSIRTEGNIDKNILSTVKLTSNTVPAAPSPVSAPSVSTTPSLTPADPSAQGFAVQLAALSAQPNLSAYRNLGNLGTVYAREDQGVFKVRVGVYPTRTQAEAALRTAKQQGYANAFIVEESNTPTSAPQPQEQPQSTAPSTSTPQGTYYLLQLGAFRNSINLDTSSLNPLGTVSEWPKGEFKVLALGDFNSVEAARQILPQVKAAGFTDAFVVKVVNGQLTRI